MDAIYERCCGLDIHKRTVVACIDRAGLRPAVAEGDPHVRHHD